MDRLSDLGNDFYVACVLCTHFTRWKNVDLRARVGCDALIKDVLRRFKCRNCGTHSATITRKRPSLDLRLNQRYALKPAWPGFGDPT
jgi:hypothetical protein